MRYAMVTARMTEEKKREGARVLESLGLTASGLINEVYDYLILQRKSPLAQEEEEPQPRHFTQEEIAEAVAWANSLPQIDRFSTMTDDEIKQERLIARGLATPEDFQ